MKNSAKKTFFSVAFSACLTLFLVSCSSDDDNGGSISNPGVSTGTFVGNLQVTDDPQTNLGYVYNTELSVSSTGSNATVKVTGEDGLNKEFTGTVTFSNAEMAAITIKKQTKPVEKIAAGDVVIDSNNLTVQISLADDSVVVKETPTSAATTTISGKINMIGTQFLKK